MGGHVEDSGLGVLKRRPEIQAPPGCLFFGVGPLLKPQAMAIASKEPPMVSVADVVVERENTSLRSKPATDSGATRNWAHRTRLPAPTPCRWRSRDSRGERRQDPRGARRRRLGVARGVDRRPAAVATSRSAVRYSCRGDRCGRRAANGRGEVGGVRLEPLGQFGTHQSGGSAARRRPGLCSAVATDVTRSTNSCASSTASACPAAPPISC